MKTKDIVTCPVCAETHSRYSSETVWQFAKQKLETEKLALELERANKRIAALTEALEFYANGPCMTYPTIKPPRDMPLRDIPKFIVESTVSVVRDVARKALEDK